MKDSRHEGISAMPHPALPHFPWLDLAIII
ncbi:MAG: hypothetical protein JWR77_1720, partial [Rhizorhabdus sp.]|nr:hypothetical protein [Rhizorhabdus sp.]